MLGLQLIISLFSEHNILWLGSPQFSKLKNNFFKLQYSELYVGTCEKNWCLESSGNKFLHTKLHFGLDVPITLKEVKHGYTGSKCFK